MLPKMEVAETQKDDFHILWSSNETAKLKSSVFFGHNLNPLEAIKLRCNMMSSILGDLNLSNLLSWPSFEP
jgi:hypothetical protein